MQKIKQLLTLMALVAISPACSMQHNVQENMNFAYFNRLPLALKTLVIKSCFDSNSTLEKNIITLSTLPKVSKEFNKIILEHFKKVKNFFLIKQSNTPKVKLPIDHRYFIKECSSINETKQILNFCLQSSNSKKELFTDTDKTLLTYVFRDDHENFDYELVEKFIDKKPFKGNAQTISTLRGAILARACSHNNFERVKKLIKQNAAINTEDKKFFTPLIAACRTGNNILIKYLLEHDADIFYKCNKNNKTTLEFACSTGNYYVASLLLEKAQKTNLFKFQEQLNNFLLHEAVKSNNTQIVILLVKFNISLIDPFGDSLFTAVKNNNLEIVKLLIEGGNNVNFTDVGKNMQTPFSCACLQGFLPIVQYLVEKNANINLPDSFENSPFYYACLSCSTYSGKYINKTPTIRYLLQQKNLKLTDNDLKIVKENFDANIEIMQSLEEKIKD